MKSILTKDDDPRLQHTDKMIEDITNRIRQKSAEAVVRLLEQRASELKMQIQGQEIMVQDFKAKLKE